MNPTCDPVAREIPSPGADSPLVDRGEVEQLLRDRDSLWHALFAQSRDGVVVLDQNGKVYEANQRFADTLTGAANRAEFSRLLNLAIAHAHAYAGGLGLVMFDLDHFKRINDTHGHDIGDAVLKGVMAVVRECTREGDLIGRWGGEEFMLLLPNADLAQALRAAERVRQGIEAHRFAPAERVTASFGVVTLAHGERFDVLIKRVDIALYRAKSAGRNRVATQDVE